MYWARQGSHHHWLGTSGEWRRKSCPGLYRREEGAQIQQMDSDQQGTCEGVVSSYKILWYPYIYYIWCHWYRVCSNMIQSIRKRKCAMNNWSIQCNKNFNVLKENYLKLVLLNLFDRIVSLRMRRLQKERSMNTESWLSMRPEIPNPVFPVNQSLPSLPKVTLVYL